MLKNKFLLAIITTLSILQLTGCNHSANSAVQTNQGSKLNSNKEDTDTVEYIADSMSITPEENKEFYIMKVKDDYLEISNDFQWVYTGEKGKYPEMEDGQIAYVKADVSIYDGGEAGYMGNSFIEELKESQIISYAEANKLFEFEDASKSEFSYSTRILRFEDEKDEEDEGNIQEYLIVLNRNFIEVYRDEQPIIEYKYADMDSKLEGFWDFLNDDTISIEHVENQDDLDAMQFYFTIINNTEMKYTFGLDYSIEKEVDGEWTLFEPDESFAWHDIAYILEPGGTFEVVADLTYYASNRLSPGRYRLVKEVTGDTDGMSKTLYAEFDID